jgi:hypothetical protein
MLLAIDPGSSGTGWALFDANLNVPRACGVLSAVREKTWQMRGVRVVSSLLEVMEYHATSYGPITEAVVEFPAFFSSAKGYAAAAKGNLVKLAWFVGVVDGAIRITYGINVVLVPVNDWKGQMDKIAVVERIRRRIGRVYKSHAADAVGLGLWYKGIF